MVRLLLWPAVALLLGVSAGSQVSAEPRAVIELFTSQGCSSCPAADKLAGEIARDPSVIVLTMPVDYWDYLGWKDTLALKTHTQRQRAYSKSRGDREVYTPQVVVNGMIHALGSDRAAIDKAIQTTRASNAPMNVPVALDVSGDRIEVRLPDAGGARQGEVWLCPVSRSVRVEIGRGENKGRVITYTNVVRSWIKLGDWDGKARTFTATLPAGQGEQPDGVAVLVQPASGTETPRPLWGAAQAALR